MKTLFRTSLSHEPYQSDPKKLPFVTQLELIVLKKRVQNAQIKNGNSNIEKTEYT